MKVRDVMCPKCGEFEIVFREVARKLIYYRNAEIDVNGDVLDEHDPTYEEELDRWDNDRDTTCDSCGEEIDIRDIELEDCIKSIYTAALGKNGVVNKIDGDRMLKMIEFLVNKEIEDET